MYLVFLGISALVPLGISCNFKDTGFTLLIKLEVIGYGILCDGLYSVQLKDNNAYNSLSLTTSIKQSVMNEESSLLWHWRLGHIFIQRIKKLVNEGVLSSLWTLPTLRHVWIEFKESKPSVKMVQ